MLGVHSADEVRGAAAGRRRGAGAASWATSPPEQVGGGRRPRGPRPGVLARGRCDALAAQAAGSAWRCRCTSRWTPARTGRASPVGRGAARCRGGRATRGSHVVGRGDPLRQHRGHHRPHLRLSRSSRGSATRVGAVARRSRPGCVAHAACSAAALLFREADFTMVRARHLALRALAVARRPTSRGCSPTGATGSSSSRRWRWRARVGQVKDDRRRRPDRLRPDVPADAADPAGGAAGGLRRRLPAGAVEPGAGARARPAGAGGRPGVHGHRHGRRDRHPRRRGGGRGDADRAATASERVTVEELAELGRDDQLRDPRRGCPPLIPRLPGVAPPNAQVCCPPRLRAAAPPSSRIQASDDGSARNHGWEGGA